MKVIEALPERVQFLLPLLYLSGWGVCYLSTF